MSDRIYVDDVTGKELEHPSQATNGGARIFAGEDIKKWRTEWSKRPDVKEGFVAAQERHAEKEAERRREEAAKGADKSANKAQAKGEDKGAAAPGG